MEQAPFIDRRTAPATSGSPFDRANAERCALVWLDPQVRIRSWSDEAEKITGYRASDVAGQPVSLVYCDGDSGAAQVEQDLALAAQNGIGWRDGWLVCESGARLWAETVLTAVRGPDQSLAGFSFAFRDISARRASNDAVRGTERRYYSLIEGIEDYAIFWAR